jgi:hypothetical protein
MDANAFLMFWMVAFLESVFIFEPGAGDPASRDKAD